MHSSIPPVPYPVTAELDTRLGIAKSMRAKGIPVVLYERSYTPSTIGDAAGKTKGVKSGTVEGKCHPLEHSGTVPAEGRYLVRHGDRFWMNGL
ncbi:type IV secretion protein Rhs [Pseudomonas taiwanensis]|nr:type IV secretion protein Rhs [Pseudomonas taiwanensis]